MNIEHIKKLATDIVHAQEMLTALENELRAELDVTNSAINYRKRGNEPRPGTLEYRAMLAIRQNPSILPRELAGTLYGESTSATRKKASSIRSNVKQRGLI